MVCNGHWATYAVTALSQRTSALNPRSRTMSFSTPDTATQRTANSHLRLINIQARGATLASGHHLELRKLLSPLKGKQVTNIWLDAYANNDEGVANRRAESVAKAIESISRELNLPVAGKIWRTSHNAATSKRSKPGKDEAYWRGVDVGIASSAAAVPTPTPVPANQPPYPGNRHKDWEVYAAWGNQFNVIYIASVGFNVYHFRRRSHPATNAWFGSVTFGASLDATKDTAKMAAQAPQLVRLVRKIGVQRLANLLKHAGPAREPLMRLLEGLKTAAGTQSEPSYSRAETTFPINLDDLNGATVSTAGGEANAVLSSYSVARMNVRAKIPVYQLKLRDHKMVWMDTSLHTNQLIMDNVDVGGWGGNLSAWPEASISFVGGPLVRL